MWTTAGACLWFPIGGSVHNSQEGTESYPYNKPSTRIWVTAQANWGQLPSVSMSNSQVPSGCPRSVSKCHFGPEKIVPLLENPCKLGFRICKSTHQAPKNLSSIAHFHTLNLLQRLSRGQTGGSWKCSSIKEEHISFGYVTKPITYIYICIYIYNLDLQLLPYFTGLHSWNKGWNATELGYLLSSPAPSQPK